LLCLCLSLLSLGFPRQGFQESNHFPCQLVGIGGGNPTRKEQFNGKAVGIH